MKILKRFLLLVAIPSVFALVVGGCDGDEWPSAGVLIVEGEGGTEARLTALSSTTYIVDADTDGDGTYDWHSGDVNWS